MFSNCTRIPGSHQECNPMCSSQESVHIQQQTGLLNSHNPSVILSEPREKKWNRGIHELEAGLKNLIKSYNPSSILQFMHNSTNPGRTIGWRTIELEIGLHHCCNPNAILKPYCNPIKRHQRIMLPMTNNPTTFSVQSLTPKQGTTATMQISNALECKPQ